MDAFLKDLRHSARMFLRSPGFTIAAVAALALGIGANTAVFSVVNTVLLKPLPYPDPSRIIQFTMTTAAGAGVGASIPKYFVWRAQTSVFDDIAAYDWWGGAGFTLSGGSEPEQVRAVRVTPEYFKLFGVRIDRGRAFTADEDRPGGRHVVVLSTGLWKRRFGSDPTLVGKTILLSGQPYTVAGIGGAGMERDLDADLWLPFQLDPASGDQAHTFVAAARLKPGVSLAMANARMQIAAEQFRSKFPGVLGPHDGFGVQPLTETIVGDVRSSLLVLVCAVALVLLIACSNVANLLLVRATGRKREIAIRAAVGAGRARIMRQLVTESVMLSLAGGVLGLALGFVGVRALLAINPGNIPRIGENGSAVALDWRVLVFTLGVSLITGVLFGLIPALGASRADLSATLKESSSRSGTGLRHNRTRSLLVITEMALAIVLLIGAALLIRSFVALRYVDPGFDPHQVLTMRMSLRASRFDKTAPLAQLGRDALERIDALPGVVSATVSCCMPLENWTGLPVIIEGRPLTGAPSLGRLGWSSAAPGYFETFKIPMLRGRAFTARDDKSAPRVAIISQSMARKFWAHGDPLNDRIVVGVGMGPGIEEGPRQIVGIVGDVRQNGLDTDPKPMVYVPFAQVSDGITLHVAEQFPITWMIRTRVEPHSLAMAIKNELRSLSGGLPISEVRTMDEVIVANTARANFNMLLLSIFGGSALLLAAIGIYGLMAYVVAQRRQEIGIRVVLGASKPDVQRMLLGQGMRLALIGVAIGIACAFGLTRLMASLLFGVQPWDPPVFVSVPVLLSAVALMSVWLPARRAMSIDPVEALRHE